MAFQTRDRRRRAKVHGKVAAATAPHRDGARCWPARHARGRVHHQLVATGVVLIPEIARVPRPLVTARTDTGELRRDGRPPAFRASRSIGGPRRRPQNAERRTVGNVVEPIAKSLRADDDRVEKYSVMISRRQDFSLLRLSPEFGATWWRPAGSGGSARTRRREGRIGRHFANLPGSSTRTSVRSLVTRGQDG